ncbi:SDR family NAD(P)-dependent oxidoreductase [Curtobacterium poinsettiae]|uniref:SDR family NAD(P)-dependent oxidoreductase n=1 Tax=Curtobacterium poinsettiae TaxID=159612 RepID=UPI0021C5DEDD|nr:SDR family NAD(P)-dependent oxidoreductase [Curtobacterium flaccumfaciens]MCU0152494.1 SDR family NAD(P)-dependent oxidoreductase [Curtobacterium flaccumfaciens pv. poinsettiae]UXN15533.1 SDR family NAD(P)-dependent oxidoreductase [Curtobacterium flaccumfaciens pv. poinsettiae]
MARILVTGSTDGLGRGTADALLRSGHDVVVHARNRARAEAVADLVERGAELVVADLADRDAVIATARELDAGTALDAVVHNAGVISGRSLVPVNVVAPYLFTALLRSPERHVYLSSGMHRGGRPRLDTVDWTGASETNSYSDTKLFVTALAAEVPLRRPGVLSNAVDPGWVATKMGGAGAPDDFELGHRTQETLATDPDQTMTGGYWFHGEQQAPHPAVADQRFRTELLDTLAEATGITL